MKHLKVCGSNQPMGGFCISHLPSVASTVSSESFAFNVSRVFRKEDSDLDNGMSCVSA